MSVPCELCSAKCCKNYDVFIDHEDIKKFDDIRCFKIIEYQKSFGYVPKFHLYKSGKKVRYVICLSNTGQVCNFLKDDRCSVYNDRPLICKTYPHFIDKDKVKEMKNLCPVKWNLSEYDTNILKKNYDKLLINFLVMETICDEWNKIVTKEDDLIVFLNFVKNYKFL